MVAKYIKNVKNFVGMCFTIVMWQFSLPSKMTNITKENIHTMRNKIKLFWNNLQNEIGNMPSLRCKRKASLEIEVAL